MKPRAKVKTPLWASQILYYTAFIHKNKEPNMVVHPIVLLRRLSQEDPLSPGVQGHTKQHSKTVRERERERDREKVKLCIFYS
jgi:hypothetical protein